MAMKGYSASPKTPSLLEPHYQIVSVKYTCCGGVLPHCRGSSRYILQPQPTGPRLVLFGYIYIYIYIYIYVCVCVCVCVCVDYICDLLKDSSVVSLFFVLSIKSIDQSISLSLSPSLCICLSLSLSLSVYLEVIVSFSDTHATVMWYLISLVS